jgi:hypothetical protein
MKESLNEVNSVSWSKCILKAHELVSENAIQLSEVVSYAESMYKLHNGRPYNSSSQLNG